MRARLSEYAAAARNTRRLVTVIGAIGLASLATFSVATVTGCGTPPTKLETRFYDIDTNLLPRVVWVTNEIVRGGAGGARGGWERGEAEGARGEGSTELGAAPVYQTNVTLVTNYDEAYTYTPNERARTVSAVAGAGAGLLGPIGELVTLLCAGAFGVWGQLRSSRATRVAGVLAQVIETGRAVLQASPQGQKLDEQWKNWMITHQAQQGVIEDVVKLLGTVVDDGTAKEAAARLLELMGRS